MMRLNGQGASPFDAYGILRFDIPATKDAVFRKSSASDSSDNDEARFSQAILQAQSELARLEQDTARRIGDEEAAIFAVQKMLAADEDFTEGVKNALADGKPLEQAIKESAEDVCRILEQTGDEYLRRRTGDVGDVAARILRILSGEGEIALPEDTEPFILAANDLSPSRTALLDPKTVLGIVTEQGSIQGHTAILARTLRISAVVNVGPIPRDWEGRLVLLLGETGELILEPDEQIMEKYRRKQALREQQNAAYEELRGKANETADGHRILVYANAASPREIRAALDNDAEGIGLFRSEVLFLSSSQPPDEETQTAYYREAAEILEGRKLIIRTLDVGADKSLPYFHLPKEENPALGLRAIRFSLSHPDIFLVQLRAILRASAYGNVALMLPLIVTVQEVKDAKKWIAQAKKELRSEGKAFREDIEIGIMIETPAAALISADLAKEVDFFSIGTNDLIQYTLAADRQNPMLADMLPQDHEAVFCLLREAIEAAHNAGIWCGICGELGADTALTKRLIRMGVDELSVVPSAVLPLRAAIRNTQFKPANRPEKE